MDDVRAGRILRAMRLRLRWSRLQRQYLTERTSPDHLDDVVERMIGLHAQVMQRQDLLPGRRQGCG